MIFIFFVIKKCIFLDCDHASIEKILQLLLKYKLRAKCAIEDKSNDYNIIALENVNINSVSAAFPEKKISCFSRP